MTELRPETQEKSRDGASGRWALQVTQMFTRIRSRMGESDTEDWEPINSEIAKRNGAFLQARNVHKIGEETFPAALELAAVDVFVEKAQRHLTSRGLYYFVAALVTCGLLCFVLALAYFHLQLFTSAPGFIRAANEAAPIEGGVNWGLTIMWLTRAAGIAAVFSTAIYMLATLARAFFHESTVLLNRKHALRFGRIFIYLKFAGLKKTEVAEQRKALTIADLERAFGWNIETGTAFKEISGKDASANIYGRAMDLAGKALEKGEPEPKSSASGG